MKSLQQVLESKNQQPVGRFRVNNELWKYFPSKFVELPRIGINNGCLYNICNFYSSLGMVHNTYTAKLTAIGHFERMLTAFYKAAALAFVQSTVVRCVLLFNSKNNVLSLTCYGN